MLVSGSDGVDARLFGLRHVGGFKGLKSFGVIVSGSPCVGLRCFEVGIVLGLQFVGSLRVAGF